MWLTELHISVTFYRLMPNPLNCAIGRASFRLIVGFGLRCTTRYCNLRSIGFLSHCRVTQLRNYDQASAGRSDTGYPSNSLPTVGLNTELIASAWEEYADKHTRSKYWYNTVTQVVSQSTSVYYDWAIPRAGGCSRSYYHEALDESPRKHELEDVRSRNQTTAFMR